MLRPWGAGAGRPRRAAALGGQGSDAAASPFSCPSPCSPASSSSLGPRRRRRRLSLGASRASLLHQGRAAPQGPSRKQSTEACEFPLLKMKQAGLAVCFFSATWPLASWTHL
ncbi:uncharacterized protein LOC132519732 isoform X1 [Lagenorhynchus albirostris]|uniref:uncharacterized protein LOC132519732 isoform X1 n=1 Tax=Lagenorhynchus albirostris TaxID=27610 RepID=UPI0028EF4E77|nr:uncharacterized protein LOC132519732 isoform X1 [Lagenorhynchus albirostris]